MRAEDAFWAFRKLFGRLPPNVPRSRLRGSPLGGARLLDFIEELVERSEGAPILVSPSRVPTSSSSGRHGEEKLDAESIQLTPLSAESSDELIRLLGETSCRRTHGEHIATRAEGNPLFIEQLVAFRRGGSRARPPIRFQARSNLSSRRVSTASLPSERALLERASIIGLILARAVSLPCPPTRPRTKRARQWLEDLCGRT